MKLGFEKRLYQVIVKESEVEVEVLEGLDVEVLEGLDHVKESAVVEGI